MENRRSLCIVILLISLTCLSFFIYKWDNEKREIKEDLIELSNIQYGLFNVDEWKKILADIITKKIKDFEIDATDRKQMKKKVMNFLYKVIGDLEDRYNEQNSRNISGFIKRKVARITGIFSKVKQDIPIFTNQILDFVIDPKNEKAVRSYLIDKLNEYADNTFAEMDYSIHDSIISKYKFADRASTISSLNLKLDDLQNKVNYYKYLLALLSLLTGIYILIVKRLTKIEYILLTLTCLLFLIIGLSLPMIEIDARVSEIKINLIGEQINFKDQVLYYKSKSILEVVKLMISQSSFDLIFVGLLVFVFSVFFPLSKLTCSIALVSYPNLRSNKIILFLVHKTGKWSMADVLVVAIFMAYIGFSGILTEQLSQIENLSQNVEVLTTNKSSLQIGFFAFASFAILSLLVTNKLKSSLIDLDSKGH